MNLKILFSFTMRFASSIFTTRFNNMQKLFMLILGATPKTRHIEQHDIFFGVASNVKELIPNIIAYWPEAEGRIHIDAWREVTCVDGCSVTVIEKGEENTELNSGTKLFFLNLGGYKPGEFEEYHYKMLVACSNKTEAIQRLLQAKQAVSFVSIDFQKTSVFIRAAQ